MSLQPGIAPPLRAEPWTIRPTNHGREWARYTSAARLTIGWAAGSKGATSTAGGELIRILLGARKSGRLWTTSGYSGISDGRKKGGGCAPAAGAAADSQRDQPRRVVHA